MRSFLKHILPWFITLCALYYAFKGINWSAFYTYLKNADRTILLGAALCTFSSYLLRARRWEYFFPEFIISYTNAVKVLFLGFFMNNALPARAGELVRAHAGARITHTKRTLVLATVFSERLADGLTISALFAIFALGIGEDSLSKDFSYVAIAFSVAAFGVILALVYREVLFKALNILQERSSNRATKYTWNRMMVFLEGLSPLCNPRKLPYIVISSLAVWLIELSVYVLIGRAYGSNLSLSQSVLFLVSVNFSSLIPAAPGGIGVIEAVTVIVLASLGINREHALAMVMTQHIMQYIIVGIPGAWAIINLREQITGFRNQELVSD